MKILALDSTAMVVTAALCNDDRLVELFTDTTGFTHSETLLPAVMRILGNTHLSVSDIDLFALSRGPGSFTGVRIGAAVIKGLAFGREKPCVGVSTLEALAENMRGTAGIICPVMDARRNQFYSAVFSSDGNTVTRLTPDAAISADDLAKELEKYRGQKLYLTGDGYEIAQNELSVRGAELCVTDPACRAQNAYSVARVAYRAYLRGDYTTDIALLPSYLRLPQAERERLERLKSEK